MVFFVVCFLKATFAVSYTMRQLLTTQKVVAQLFFVHFPFMNS